INIPSTVGGTTAYVGFTGGTDGLTATQDILTWTFSPHAATSPNAPSRLGATPAPGTPVPPHWTNHAPHNQTRLPLPLAPAAAPPLPTDPTPPAPARQPHLVHGHRHRAGAGQHVLLPTARL